MPDLPLLPTPPLAPPQNLQALRELVVRIGRGEAGISLGAKALGVIARLVERPEEVALRSITELATTLGVNASTLSRLARSLGYDGFPAFQAVFRASLADTRRFYSEQGHRLLAADPAADGAQDAYLGTVVTLARESMRNIGDSLAQLDAAELRAAARLLARARRVGVLGLRQIHAVASVLGYGLGLIRPDVGLLDAPGQGLAERLAHMGRHDVLLAISISPYSRRVVETCRVAVANGVTLIALTDSRASPLAAHADHAFYLPHAGSFISNSLAAYVVFSEGLVNLVARELGNKALLALQQQERYIAELNIEMQ